jgi:hypothetical protein
MNFRFTIVETSLNRTEFRWKWLRFLQYSFVLGTILSLLALFFGGAILCGWVTSKALAVSFFVMLGVVGLIAWAVVILSVMAGAPDRHWLAAAVERVDRRFMDRLNTLLFLEDRRAEPCSESFAHRIARQTQQVVAEKPPPSPFSTARPLTHMVVFLGALTAAVLLYQLYTPWGQLLAAQKPKPAAPAHPQTPLELALPATNNVEQHQAWGEVRITDPGTDLKVTKVDVVPLQIEAAANQPLKDVSWLSTINGAGETQHELPPPAEPRYAVYQPTIYLDELGLSDWDVMTYYAKANTGKQNSYASEVYFLEVRPFREDILKMPGGEGGKAYQSLSEISSLIGRQQHIIRQTHQHLQQPPEQETVQAQDRKKLSEAEGDLSGSTRHLYAKMAAEMENKPIGDALDNLAKAEKSLDSASKLLGDNVMNEAQNHERSALSELVAARKMFQKAVSDNPGAFNDQNQKEDEASPVANDASKKLNEMAEFRNEAKAAQEFVQKALEQQKGLEQQAGSAPRSDYPRLSAREQQLQKSLDNFQGQHPQAFKGTQPESRQAQQAMGKAADSLRQRNESAQADTQQATQQLQNLSEAMQNQAAQQQLADAYKLKQMLDQQIQNLDQRAKPDSKAADADLQQAARDARQTIDQLKKTAEQQPTRDAFGQPLRDALAGRNKEELDAKLNQLEQPGDGANSQQRAAGARDALGKVSKAFDASQPEATQMARKADSLKPGDQDSFAQGMAELDSLIKELENDRQVPPKDQAKQGQQALYNLQTGMRSQHGNNDGGNQILRKLQQMLQAETPLDVGDLKKLMDELQRFSAEASGELAKKQDQPEVANIDPARLPPAYRGRIQKYFQRLSEQ